MSWYKPSASAHYLYDGAFVEDHDGMMIVSAQREGGVHFVCLEGPAIKELFRYIEKTRGVKITVEEKERSE